MSDIIIYTIGFSAQLLYGTRMVIQWIQSEKEKEVVSSPLFWKTSLAASILLMIYGLLRHDGVIILGQIASYYIYVRNLQLNGVWKSFSSFSKVSFLALPLLILLPLFFSGAFDADQFIRHNSFSHPLIFAGWIGQLCMNTRFIYQLYVAEKAQQSIIPFGFWVISVFGATLVLMYALYRADPVLILAQLLGLFIYARNIVIERRTHRKFSLRGK